MQVIQQIKALPPRERAKVSRFVYSHRLPNATTRRALKEDVSKATRFSSLTEFMADLKSDANAGSHVAIQAGFPEANLECGR